MRRFLKNSCGAALLATVASGCGVFGTDDDHSSSGEGIVNHDNRGCIQGVVLDGLNQSRLAFPKQMEYGKQGIYVLVRNKLLQARPLVADPENETANKNLLGEYYVCGIPLDVEFPVFAWIDGYQAFEGLIKIDSTIAQRTAESDQVDIPLEFPTLLADFKLYPVGIETQDLKFTVFHTSARVKEARVVLKPVGTNLLDNGTAGGQRYTVPPQIRLASLEGSTDENGEVIFSKDQLVLGGRYEYTVFPPNGGTEASLKTGTLTVGLRNEANLTDQPYELAISLDTLKPQLEVLYDSSTEFKSSVEGKVELVFSDEVELVANKLDGLRAVVTGAARDGAKLEDDVPGNDQSESVNVEIDGHRLTLTPKWAIAPSKEKDPRAQVIYTGLVVRAKGENRDSMNLDLDKLSIGIFTSL